MKNIQQSLFWRLSLLLLVMLTIFSTIQLLFTLRSVQLFTRETDQKLNISLANDLAQHFERHLGLNLDITEIENQFQDLLVMNPRVEWYLLDETGTLITHFTDRDKIKQWVVSMDPIKDFLDNEPLPILGDDPRGIDNRKPFSVAPVLIGDKPGYLYVVLGNQHYDTISGMVAQSSIVRSVTLTVIGMFIIIALIGFFILFRVTKRLRSMTSAVKMFESGETSVRIDDESKDEIGQLGRTFNKMSDTIVNDIIKLEQTDRLRRDLIANISHDLRSPLASVKGYIETILIKENTLSKKQHRTIINTILNSVDGLSVLVEQLLELSKLETKQIEPNKEPFSIAELTQDVVLKFQPIASKKQIHISSSSGSADIPMILGDIGMIERALSNLIENAIQYTPDGGAIRVDVKRSNSFINVFISDTGQGIHKDDLPHVFDRFYRAEKSRSRSSGGSGLGLAISQAILEAHDSKIMVESKVNAGTTFYFRLSY